ncbi:MAG: lipocalin-like domain-containing protein [Polyangiaceae bacterium]
MRLRGALLLVVVVVALIAVAVVRMRAPRAATHPVLTVLQALGPGPHDDKFARADAPREFRFPEDHGPHPEFRNEWWYWTGNLTGSQGRAFGYELTIFRTALAPDRDVNRASAWAPRDVYMAHFTVTDVRAERFHAFERTSRGALDLAGASAVPFRAWVLDWSATGEGEGGALPFHLRAADGGVVLDLVLEQGKPTVLEGERGLSRKGAEPGNASYYYSLTRMPTSGSITIAGERFDVRGESWMDREWSTRALSGDQVGWNWFAIRLDDGREIMFFHLRRRDGSSDPWSSGTLVETDGTPRALRAEDVTVLPVGTWKSPRSQIAYPASFRVSIPRYALDLQVLPLLADQELALTFRYWEGAVRIDGGGPGGKKIGGLGYLELTGYGEESRQPR